MRFLMIVCVFALSFGCSDGTNVQKPNVNASNIATKPVALPVYGYEIVRTYPHDPKAFTEGLFYNDGFLYESTGQEGKSSLRKVEIETGKVVQKFDLPPQDFGEGISIVNGKIYQLTWRDGLCRVFDAKTFKLVKELHYQGEGWGLTTDGSALYMSQGTHVLKVMDAETFKQAQTVPVMREDGKPLMQINELEWVKGEIWANVWHSETPDILGKPNYIARIEPATGKLLGWINLAGISPEDQPQGTDPYDPKAENTLNGIA
jgi:glutaminyl-peptide cyclotransferase